MMSSMNYVPGSAEVRQTTYGYDPLSQLTAVTATGTKTSYVYDPVGNRTTVNGTRYTVNGLNQYTSVGATTLRYDKNGTLIFAGANTYTYDSENRLIKAERPGMAVSYAYDALGRRASKTVSATGLVGSASGGNGVTTSYLYDGDQLIAELDMAGKIVTRYVYGLGLDEPLVMLKAGKTYYFHRDPLGSIIALTGSRGELIEQYRYDPFGTPTILAPDGTVRPTSIVGNRFLFTGREYDAETGLYYYRQRYYNPRLGRFLQRDPIGYLPDTNLYRYVTNNPINFTDPYGLKKYIAVAASAGAGRYFINAEGGEIVAIDPDTGKVYQFQYIGGGPGIGIGVGGVAGSVNVEVGAVDFDSPRDLAGPGLAVSAFAAAGKGVAIQLSGTGPFGSGASGLVGGLAVGGGAGISGLVTYTWFKGVHNLKDLNKNTIQVLREAVEGALADERLKGIADPLEKLRTLFKK